MVNIQQVKNSFSKCYFQSLFEKEYERTAGSESFMKVRFGLHETVWMSVWYSMFMHGKREFLSLPSLNIIKSL